QSGDSLITPGIILVVCSWRSTTRRAAGTAKRFPHHECAAARQQLRLGIPSTESTPSRFGPRHCRQSEDEMFWPFDALKQTNCKRD
ncbi:MAG: hypothetical protein ACE5I1_28450, partial [bacterium]